MELQENYEVFQQLNAEIISIAQIERDPAMLPRISEFVHPSFPIVADPEQETREDFEIFSIYLIDKEGILQTYIPGVKEARPRLDMILEELAKIEGVDAPEVANVLGHPGVDAPKTLTKERPKISPEDVIRVRWMWSHNMVRAKDRFKLAFISEIAPGYHVYGSDEKRMTPFKLDLDLPKGIELYKEYAYPQAAMVIDPILKIPFAMYENNIAMPVIHLRASEKIKPGNYIVKATLHYQACDDVNCLVPTKKTLELPLKVVPKDQARGTVAGHQIW